MWILFLLYIHLNYFFSYENNSLFDKYPQVRETHFQALLSSSNDMKTTLEKHGTKVLNAVGAMVSALKDEDDARLLAKISQVTLDSIHTDSIENV